MQHWSQLPSMTCSLAVNGNGIDDESTTSVVNGIKLCPVGEGSKAHVPAVLIALGWAEKVKVL